MIERISLHRPERAVLLLISAGVVALPTDTVYGVAASLRQPRAVARLFELKQRPVTVALPILIGDLDQLADLGVDFDDRARRVTERFWPGALTVIVKASDAVAQLVGSANGTVGVRLPDDPAIVALLRLSGPLAVTSANRHGEAPCTSADEVDRAFAGSDQLDALVDGGPRSGAVSTVLDVSTVEPRVLREGAISAEALMATMKEI